MSVGTARLRPSELRADRSHLGTLAKAAFADCHIGLQKGALLHRILMTDRGSIRGSMMRLDGNQREVKWLNSAGFFLLQSPLIPC